MPAKPEPTYHSNLCNTLSKKQIDKYLVQKVQLPFWTSCLIWCSVFLVGPFKQTFSTRPTEKRGKIIWQNPLKTNTFASTQHQTLWILTTWPRRNGSLTGENYLALAVAESRHRSICVNRNFELLVTRCILIQAYQKKSYIRTKLSNPSRDMLLYSCPYAPIRLVSEFATITLIVGGELWGDTAVQTPSSSAPHHQLLIIIPLHF